MILFREPKLIDVNDRLTVCLGNTTKGEVLIAAQYDGNRDKYLFVRNAARDWKVVDDSGMKRFDGLHKAVKYVKGRET